MKNIQEILEELRENNLTSVSVGSADSWVESYKGLRHETIEITDSIEKFINDKNCLLLLSVNGVECEENIKQAYKLLLAQKFALPQIL